ncbi:MAG: hypothetical protein RLZZ253_1836, partial [Verrucomicrobiota bacterium]
TYRDSLDILQKLSASDPTDIEWKRGVESIQTRIELARKRIGNPAEPTGTRPTKAR